MEIIIIVSILLAAAMAASVAALFYGQKVPVNMPHVPLADQQAPAAAAALFREQDAQAFPLGFSPVTNYSLPLSNRSTVRLYLHSNGATTLSVAVVEAKAMTGALVEIATRFEDGTAVVTNNATHPQVYHRLPGLSGDVLPGEKNLAPLLNKHREKALPLIQAGKKPLVITGRALEQVQQDNERVMKYQVERRAMRVDPAGHYRLTLPFAIRAVGLNFNPFGSEFSLKKLLLAIVPAVVIPLANVLWAGNLAGDSTSLMVNMAPGMIVHLLCLPGFAIAGAIIGWSMEIRGIIWSYIVAVPAGLVASAYTETPFMLVLVTLLSAGVAQQLRRIIKFKVGWGLLILNLFLLLLMASCGLLQPGQIKP